MSISGLASIDQYEFSGETAVTLPNGVSGKPKAYRGKVIDHEKLIVQSEGESTSEVNPAKLLAWIQNSPKEVSLMKSDQEGLVQLSIHMKGDAPAAKLTEQLQSELTALAADAPKEGAAYRKAWEEEFHRSKQQLNEVLKTLRVKSDYKLYVDRNKMLPMQLEEYSMISYVSQGRSHQETRRSRIALESFNGRTSSPVQAASKHGTIRR